MEDVEEVMMQKERVQLPIIKMDLFGTMQKEQVFLIEPTENLQITIKPICLFWKIISVPIIQVGMKL